MEACATHHLPPSPLKKRAYPKAKGKKDIIRKVSKTTRSLYDKNERNVARTKQQCEQLKNKRKQAGLADFKQWVQECAARLNHANGHGDTKEIHNVVK